MSHCLVCGVGDHRTTTLTHKPWCPNSVATGDERFIAGGDA